MIIIHSVREKTWNSYCDSAYYGEEYMKDCGFIHCSDINTYKKVAGNFKSIDENIVLLVIDTEKVKAEVRWEDLGEYGTEYPHIYGLLNKDAVIEVLPHLWSEDRTWIMNKELKLYYFKNIFLEYEIKKFQEENIEDIYSLAEGNPTYYEHMKTELTRDSLRKDLTALPPDKTLEDKYFIGFYKGETLIALLDIIDGYPNDKTAFIGWFMMNKQYQKSGIGSTIITKLICFLKEMNFKYARLAYVKGNKESEGFWIKNKFMPVGIEVERKNHSVIVMQREI